MSVECKPPVSDVIASYYYAQSPPLCIQWLFDQTNSDLEIWACFVYS